MVAARRGGGGAPKCELALAAGDARASFVSVHARAGGRLGLAGMHAGWRGGGGGGGRRRKRPPPNVRGSPVERAAASHRRRIVTQSSCIMIATCARGRAGVGVCTSVHAGRQAWRRDVTRRKHADKP